MTAESIQKVLSGIVTLSYSSSSGTDDDVDNRLYLDSLKHIKLCF